MTGIGVRLPGAPDVGALWRLLAAGAEAVGPARLGTGLARAGHIAAPTRSIATACGIAADEAARMDPQQLVLLDVVRTALADSGDLPRVGGTRTAVYVGQSASDSWDARAGAAELDLRDFAGCHQRGLTAGRVSHTFDLRGPAVTVDAAQASSLVAVHHAVRALRTGDADIAIAAGVNLISSDRPARMLGAGGALSVEGRCKFGDAEADGFVRAEGAVAVVLRPLDSALADGSPVHAVILGSAVSNDGSAKESLLHPSVEGQTAAMRWSHADAGTDTSDVDYVEAHGTGTRIDVAELTALTDVLGPRGRPCLVGSVKTNIGHAEAAAGLAGLAKAVLCLRERAVPASLHHSTPHPGVDWDRVPLVVPRALTPLPRRAGPSIVAVNGQSISSTNVHVVLAAAPGRLS
ncbi:polyketide synthase [Actinokineospora sp. G85]|uniref:beta-ketoacyl [acyl carrier protein] synthase domain-containing protein n=1 Tax=Actinokineospora sp. G85 TaxID=3406626 RepID=UPI003C71332B